MPTVDVYNLEKKKVGSVDLPEAIFDVPVREHLFHELVRAQLAEKRRGTAKTKERNEVRGSQHKVWRQKGTGRARQGSRKAPHWVGGGTAFGPSPRSFEKKVNKKTRRAALCAALSRRQQEGRLIVLEAFELPGIKTRSVVDVLARFDTEKALIVDAANDVLGKSTRNLPRSAYLRIEALNVYDILRHDTLMMTRGAVEALQARLGA